MEIKAQTPRMLAAATLLAMAVCATASQAKILAEQGDAISDSAVGSKDAAVLLSSTASAPASVPGLQRAPLIVIGFMGGHVNADNLLHREALLARDLDRHYPNDVQAMTFANRDEPLALRTVLDMLDTSRNGSLSASEKSSARIVIYGHSWGGSETVNFARALGERGIPVLLTIQVDSVEKSGEDDSVIPANVHEAINFFQTEGLLHGRRTIEAGDPKRTTILGNYKSSYEFSPVSCAGFPWFARAFMKPHIEIENDGAVWDEIEALIVSRF